MSTFNGKRVIEQRLNETATVTYYNPEYVQWLEAEIERLRAIITAKLHRRKCHDCGQLEWTSKDMGKVHTCDECYRKFLERVKEVT